MHCRRTPWFLLSFYFPHIYLHYLQQTLDTLDLLRSNRIDESGAQYLADALQDNTVIIKLINLFFWHLMNKTIEQNRHLKSKDWWCDPNFSMDVDRVSFFYISFIKTKFSEMILLRATCILFSSRQAAFLFDNVDYSLWIW
jgi:hypothetical protein